MSKASFRRWARTLNGAMPVVLDASSAILLSIGASSISATVGWFTAGGALIVLNWRIYGD